MTETASESAKEYGLGPSQLGLRHQPMYEACEFESIIRNLHSKEAQHMLAGLNSESSLTFT